MSAPKVGLALGSGAARGCTHIGILEVLQEEGIEISYVSGTSIGSIVGAALAAGQLEALKEAVLGLDWRKLVYLTFDLKRIRSGLVDGRKVADFISESIQVHDFAELKLPFRCVAADLMKGEAVVFSEGDLVSAIRASISIPGMFTPVFQDERVLVDGGVVNPVPVDVVRDMGAEVVIAVDINHGRLQKAKGSLPRNMLDETLRKVEEKMGETERTTVIGRMLDRLQNVQPEDLGPARAWLAPDPVPNIFDVLGNSIRIMEAQIASTRELAHPSDVLLTPSVGNVEVLAFHKAKEMIAIGRETAIAALPQIHAALER